MAVGFLRATSAALLLVASSAMAAPYYDSGEMAVSDESTYTIAGQANENTNVAISGDVLCVHWAVGTSAGNDAYTGLRLRCYDLKQRDWKSSNVTFLRTDPTDEDSAPYHEVPAIGFQGGKWWLFNPDHTDNKACTGSGTPFSYCTGSATGNADAYAHQNTLGTGDCLLSSNKSGPYYRTVPQGTTQSTGSWSGSSTPSASLCWPTDFTGGANQPRVHDIQAVTLPNDTMIVYGQGTKISSSYSGLHRYVWRVSIAGSQVGPYAIVHGGTYNPTSNASCTNTASGNVFADAQMRQRGGVLWMAWSPRLSFQCTGSGCAGGTARHIYQLYLAKSTDGLTWTNADGGSSFTISSDESNARAYSDTNFLIYTGEMDEKSYESFDIDPISGVPVFAIRTYDSATGTPDCAGHPDTQFTSNQYRLKLLKKVGAGWSASSIEATQDWHFKVPLLFIDANGTYWLFRPAGSGFSVPSTAMAYATSGDGGVTWSSWTALSQSINTGSNQYKVDRFSSVFDPSRRFMGFTYYNATTDELFARYFDLIAPASSSTSASSPNGGGGSGLTRGY